MSEMTAAEKARHNLEEAKHWRDEQFWFTAAVVGFNGFLLTRAEVPFLYAIGGAFLVALFGVHLVMTRWLSAAKRLPELRPYVSELLEPQAPPRAAARWRHTGREIRAWLGAVWYVVAELSGTFFFLVLISVSFVGVAWKHWPW
jgi:hypothetical protein